jgi:adenosylhomocysteine nucleosidase
VGLAAEARVARRIGWPVAIGGGTADGAANAARRLLAVGASGLVSFGLAAGLDPSLKPGTIVVPAAVLIGTRRFATDATLSGALGGTTGDTVLAVEAIVPSAEEKRRLYAASGAAAADLESGAVARIAAERGVPFAVLRAICDPAGRTLPPVALDALDSRGAIAVLRLLAALLAHPTHVPALFPLAADAAAARRALIDRVRRLPR